MSCELRAAECACRKERCDFCKIVGLEVFYLFVTENCATACAVSVVAVS